MARPRETTNDELLTHAHALLLERGAAGFTLGDVAARAGVAPATLIKRFGSKSQMIIAVSERWLASIAPGMAAAMHPHDDPVERLIAGASWDMYNFDHAARAGSQLTAFADDLRDPTLRALLAEGWERETQILQSAVDDARAQLPFAPDSRKAARMLRALAVGIHLSWSIAPVGSLVDDAHDHLTALVNSWKDIR
ncbi:TetR/AcrR family transcriptional regulator [Prescottella agglutinans]|uniref:AcrR family transcriptional regulator n=1 Tax=Prescottella agglutinans TaxID=1644129 RepID=A0ABT6MHI9_9NOCA|nr:TetR/AcrR family transcriptional regulator [Prescottella agglutinans]MDH6283319.1 AcrR family transcriptional regulator [Prescottella agglutinans]